MMKTADEYARMAEQEARRGGNPEYGKVYALLAIAATTREATATAEVRAARKTR